MAHNIPPINRSTPAWHGLQRPEPLPPLTEADIWPTVPMARVVCHNDLSRTERAHMRRAQRVIRRAWRSLASLIGERI